MPVAKLFYFPGSPFARMARVLVLEMGFDLEAIELSFPPPKDLFELNQLGQVPTLLLPDGKSLFPTLIILEYLWRSAGSHNLAYDPDAERQLLLTVLQAGDALVAAKYQYWTGLGPIAENTIGYDPAERHLLRFSNFLNWLESQNEDLRQGLTLVNVALACTLLWTDARGGPDWRGNNKIQGIVDGVAQRPSFTETEPPPF
ncbi:MAG: glutathione S-transferase family protein [Boseongicola sp.]